MRRCSAIPAAARRALWAFFTSTTLFSSGQERMSKAPSPLPTARREPSREKATHFVSFASESVEALLLGWAGDSMGCGDGWGCAERGGGCCQAGSRRRRNARPRPGGRGRVQGRRAANSPGPSSLLRRRPSPPLPSSCSQRRFLRRSREDEACINQSLLERADRVRQWTHKQRIQPRRSQTLECRLRLSLDDETG